VFVRQRRALLSAVPLSALGLWAWLTPTQTSEWFVSEGGSGNGSRSAPFGRIEEGLQAARAGDTVVVAPGTYRGAIRTIRGGRAGAPIAIRAAEGRGSVLVTALGRVLTVDHPHVVAEGLILDGEYGPNDTVRISNGGSFFQLRDSEVRHSSLDLIDMGGPEDVLIEGCLLHHALNATNGRSDAHGIVASAVRNLTVRNTEIHTFSGDGLQVDPGRAVPGWDQVTIEGTRFWLAPLPSPENGFAAGVVPGENAVDTKASGAASRARMVIRDTVAYGFRGGLITNMAAFNLKENVDVTVDRVTVYDSEIAFRVRGPSGPNTPGAWVTVKNAVVHDTLTAFRYEYDIEQLRIRNSTLGRGVVRPFETVLASSGGVDVRNLLMLGTRPVEASHPSNLSVGGSAFVDIDRHDYRLAPGSPAIDAGVTMVDVPTDRDGVVRPQGRAFDVGAYER